MKTQKLLLPIPKDLHGRIQEMAYRRNQAFDRTARELFLLGLRLEVREQRRREIFSALSDRERNITVLICQDYTNAEIALRLGLHPATVKKCLTGIYKQFGVRSRYDLRRTLAGWDFSLWSF